MAKEQAVRRIIEAASLAPQGVKVATNNPRSAMTRLSVVRQKMEKEGMEIPKFRVAEMGESELWIVPKEKFNEHG